MHRVRLHGHAAIEFRAFFTSTMVVVRMKSRKSYLIYTSSCFEYFELQLLPVLRYNYPRDLRASIYQEMDAHYMEYCSDSISSDDARY